MYLLDNPVLQRELLVNLRATRSFVLLAVYLGLLGGVLFFLPPALWTFSETFLTDPGAQAWIARGRVFSPVATAFALPIDLDMPGQKVAPADWPLFFSLPQRVVRAAGLT